MTTINLRRIVDAGSFEGLRFEVIGTGDDIEPGMTYLAERNTGVKLLTCERHNRDKGWVVPVEPAYLYDTYECVPIRFVDA